jgi:hypothetical protein
MEKEIKKASQITDSFKDTFATPEAIEAGKNYTPSNKPYINKTEEKKDEKTSPINIQYFENKNPDTFGFN